MDDTFYGTHVVLQRGEVTKHPCEGLLDADGMSEHDTDLRRGDGEPGGDGEGGYDQSEENTEDIDPDTQPTLIRDCQPISSGARWSAPCAHLIEEEINLFSIFIRSWFSFRNRSVSPYARMVARPASDSEK